MMFAKVRRQWLLGVVGVALAAGLATQTYAADNLLQQVKQRGTLIVGPKAPIRRSASVGKTAS